MLTPETAKFIADFSNSIAQNIIASILVEWKKSRDEKQATAQAHQLESHEHAQSLNKRLSGRVNQAFLKFNMQGNRFAALSPLATDPIFCHGMVQSIGNNEFTTATVTELIKKCSPQSDSDNDLGVFATVLVEAVSSVIAEDPHLFRIKSLQFQNQITAQVSKVEIIATKTSESVRRTEGAINALQPQLVDISAKLSFLADNFGEKEIREKIYDDRVDGARKLMLAGKQKTGLALLQELRKEIESHNPSTSLLFRIATNIGACAIELNDRPRAIEEIEFAYRLEPNNPKAIVNLSVIYLFKNDPHKALELAKKARLLKPQDAVAASNYIHALFALGRESELDDILNQDPWIKSDAICCFAIGTLYFGRGQFVDAEIFLRLAKEKDSANPDVLLNLALSIIRPVQTAFITHPVLDWRFPPEFKPKLLEAKDLLDAGIKIQSDFENRDILAHSLVVRADIRRMLGDTSGAISDCEIALHENPNEKSALPILGLAYLRSRRFQEAINAFEKIQEEAVVQQMLLPLATAYNARNQPQKTIELLKPLWEAIPANPGQISYADQLLWACSLLNKTDLAEQIIHRIKSDWPKDPEALAAIANYRSKQERYDEAIDLLTESLAYASGPAKDFKALQLADIYYGRNNFSKAAELYETVADLKSDNDLSRHYLICIYNSGLHKEALALAQVLRNDGEPIPVVTQIEANILAEIGALKTAQSLMERLFTLYPEKHAYRISAAGFAMRQGRHASAKELVDNGNYDAMRGDANLLMQEAQIRAVLGVGDVLKYIFQARRAGYSSPQVHAAYVWMFVSREQIDKIDLEKETVDGDCGVVLEIGGAQRDYFIISAPDIHTDRAELSPAQAAEMGLIGRKKGDSFVFNKDAFGQDVFCKIVDVQSKYVRAFQETLVKFPQLFPTDKTMQGIEGPYENFREGMFKQLDRDQVALNKIIAVYEGRQITFESFAHTLRRSPVELWGMLTGGNYCQLANFSGTADEAEMETLVAEASDNMLLEFTAIFTFAQLGLLEKLKSRYQLYTTQPVLDTLAEAHANSVIAKPGLTVGKVKDQYLRQEISEQQLETNRNFLKSIIGFLTDNVKVLPVPSLLERDSTTDEIRDFLGSITVATLFGARDSKFTIFSDDQMLRALARNEYQIKCVSCQPVIQELFHRGIVTKDECVAATSKLFFLNYSVVLIGADQVMWTLQIGKFQITPELNRILSVFHGPQCTFESAIGVLSEVTKQVWLESSVLYHQNISLLDAFLDALGTNRPTNQVAEHFTQAIKSKMYLVPSTANAIAELVRLWKERKLGRSGIILPLSRPCD